MRRDSSQNCVETSRPACCNTSPVDECEAMALLLRLVPSGRTESAPPGIAWTGEGASLPNILSHLTDPAGTQSQNWGGDWARKRFWRACSFILLPFLLMLGFVAVLEIAAVLDAANDIVSIYARVNRKRTEATQAFDPEKAAQTVLGEVYDAGDKVAFPLEYRMFSRIARTVAYQVESQALSGKAVGGDEGELKRTVQWHLLLSASATWLLQATVVLFFPGMLISLVALAAWNIQRNPAPQPNQFRSFLDEARYRRSIWLLTETSQLHLWRRLGFALILTLGSTYTLRGHE
jgi:hypothetical protein